MPDCTVHEALSCNVILIGLPGSGKSSAGRQVARHFSCPFIDCDDALVADFGMSIREYFAAHGEEAFRDQESFMLQELLDRPGPFVLSTGGGAVLRAENRQLLRAGGTVLYLYASPEAIFRRLRHDTQRPLLQVADPRQQIQSLFDARDALYRETAHHVIHSGRSALQTLVHKIVRQMRAADSSAAS